MTRTGPVALAATLVLGATAFAQPTPPSPVPGPSLNPGGSACQPSCPAFGAERCGDDDGQVWADAAYLLGWVQGDPLPPLVTTSPAGTPRTAAGVLGPGTTVLFGGRNTDAGVRQGVRADVGYWFDPERQWGVEFGMFALESTTDAFSAASNGDPILARPFTDVTTNTGSSALVAFPGVSTGSIAVADSGRNFVSLNADFAGNVMDSPTCRIDALIGYRFLRYDERLGIVQSLTPTGGPFAAGTTITSTDSFSTMNIFNGLDLGVRGDFRYDAWSLELLGKVAAGPVRRTVNTLGFQQVSVPGAAPVVSSGGLLALSSNIGSVSSHTLTAVPELGVKLGYDVTPNVRLFTGYSVLWWLDVVRPGSQVDLGVNPGLIPPAAAAAGSASRPAFLDPRSSIWAQALSFGVEVKY